VYSSATVSKYRWVSLGSLRLRPQPRPPPVPLLGLRLERPVQPGLVGQQVGLREGVPEARALIESLWWPASSTSTQPGPYAWRKKLR
jgi:hypothetical protein